MYLKRLQGKSEIISCFSNDFGGAEDGILWKEQRNSDEIQKTKNGDDTMSPEQIIEWLKEESVDVVYLNSNEK